MLEARRARHKSWKSWWLTALEKVEPRGPWAGSFCRRAMWKRTMVTTAWLRGVKTQSVACSTTPLGCCRVIFFLAAHEKVLMASPLLLDLRKGDKHWGLGRRNVDSL